MIPCRPGTRLTATYLLVQGAIGALWWVLLLTMSAARTRFQPSGYPEDFILTFLLPDVLLFVAGSFVSAVLVVRGGHAGIASLWAVTGATMYAALHCIGVAWSASGFTHAAVMMTAAAACLLTLSLTLGQCPSELPTFPFRVSVNSRGRLRRLVVQIIFFWGVFLLLLPLGLSWVERRFEIPPVIDAVWWPRLRRVAGGVVFLVASAVNLWAARTMLRVGEGTPLPTECAARLVSNGPYAVVRNPMALAGVVQVLAVAILLGSWLTAGYACIGGLLWHVTVRPVEEQELAVRFGAEFERYRDRVACWTPRLPRG
jgi:protein-S-isoprenylcysteine O-methyltransferase Ste14